MRPDRPMAAMVRDQIIFQVLDELSKARALAPAESELMELTMHRLATKRDYWQWTEAEDAAVRALLTRRRARKRKAKPFQVNAEVAALAQSLGRSFWGVQRRLERLNKHRARRKSTPLQMFKRANGHAALECSDETHPPALVDSAQPDPRRANGGRAAG